jgi:hypothetical protein
MRTRAGARLKYIFPTRGQRSDDQSPIGELAGIVVTQERQLHILDSREPLVRVLIANGGTGMAHGPATAALLRDYARTDQTFVGIVGLNESRENSEATLRDLAARAN